MRSVLSVVICLMSVSVWANPPHAGPRSDMTSEWNNTLPEQRRALDHFYQALQQAPTGAGRSDDVSERMQHLEQLRDMSSEQRQQLFRNFVRDADRINYR